MWMWKTSGASTRTRMPPREDDLAEFEFDSISRPYLAVALVNVLPFMKLPPIFPSLFVRETEVCRRERG